MIKILYVMRNFNAGGAEVFLLSMLNRIDKYKFEPEVLSIYGGGVLQKEFENIGVPVHVKNFNSLGDIKNHYDFYSFLKKNKYNILHSKLFHADLVGRVGGYFASVPLIFSTIENVHEWIKPITLHQKLKLKIARHSSKVNKKIIAVSKEIKSVLVDVVKLDPACIDVIYNGVDVDKFNPEIIIGNLKSELSISTEHYLVGSIGTLNVMKNHRVLIQAGAMVRSVRDDVHFVIVGRGDQAELRSLANSLGIGKFVHFLGVRRDMPQILKSLDIYTMTSLSEGVSISLLEAMSMKKAVIVSNVGGNPEVVSRPDVGVLLPQNQPESLAHAILQVVNDANRIKSLGENARSIVVKNFNLALTVSRYEQLYFNSF